MFSKIISFFAAIDLAQQAAALARQGKYDEARDLMLNF
jgi:hypothetical protein